MIKLTKHQLAKIDLLIGNKLELWHEIIFDKDYKDNLVLIFKNSSTNNKEYWYWSDLNNCWEKR